MSVAASPTTPVKPSIQGGGPGGGGDENEEDDVNEGNEGAGGGLVNKAKSVTKAKKPVTKVSAKPKVASAQTL